MPANKLYRQIILYLLSKRKFDLRGLVSNYQAVYFDSYVHFFPGPTSLLKARVYVLPYVYSGLLWIGNYQSLTVWMFVTLSGSQEVEATLLHDSALHSYTCIWDHPYIT